MPDSNVTTDLSVLPNSAILLLIVMAKRDCQHIFSVRQGLKPASECQLCGGTGKVPILAAALMRLPCPCVLYIAGKGEDRCSRCADHIWHSKQLSNMHRDDCLLCQGRNWVPNPDAWDMRKALHLAGFQLAESHSRMGNADDVFLAHCYPYGGYLSGPRPISNADPERARYLAVAKAFGI